MGGHAAAPARLVDLGSDVIVLEFDDPDVELMIDPVLGIATWMDERGAVLAVVPFADV